MRSIEELRVDTDVALLRKTTFLGTPRIFRRVLDTSINCRLPVKRLVAFFVAHFYRLLLRVEDTDLNKLCDLLN